jgi:hypothetical protein
VQEKRLCQRAICSVSIPKTKQKTGMGREYEENSDATINVLDYFAINGLHGYHTM